MISPKAITLSALVLILASGAMYIVNTSDTAYINKNLAGNQGDMQTLRTIQKNITTSTTQSIKKEQIAHLSQISPPGFSDTPSDPNARHLAWKTSAEDFRKVPEQYTDLPSKNVDRAFLTLNRDGISALQKGGSLELSIPQTGSSFDAEVKTVDYHANGDKTIKAKIPGANNDVYTVTITQGKNATFGTISTPEGVYILESGSSEGWIASKDDLVRQQNRDVSDAVYFDQSDEDVPSS